MSKKTWNHNYYIKKVIFIFKNIQRKEKEQLSLRIEFSLEQIERSYQRMEGGEGQARRGESLDSGFVEL